MAVLNGRGAVGQQASAPGELDQAKPAGAHGAEAFEIAEARNVLAVGAGGFENGLAWR
jgi:hypothetical protein